MRQQKLETLFSEDNLRELADYNSFERGEDYFNEGNVSKIAKTQNHFEGYINGSNRYIILMQLSLL